MEEMKQKYMDSRANAVNDLRRQSLEFNQSAASYENALNTGKLDLSKAAELRQSIEAEISVNDDLAKNLPRGSDPSIATRLNQDTLRLRNELADLRRALIAKKLGVPVSAIGQQDAERPVETGGAQVGGNELPKMNVPQGANLPGARAPQQVRESEDQVAARLEQEIKAANPGISLDDLADRVIEELDRLGYQ